MSTWSYDCNEIVPNSISNTFSIGTQIYYSIYNHKLSQFYILPNILIKCLARLLVLNRFSPTKLTFTQNPTYAYGQQMVIIFSFRNAQQCSAQYLKRCQNHCTSWHTQLRWQKYLLGICITSCATPLLWWIRKQKLSPLMTSLKN